MKSAFIALGLLGIAVITGAYVLLGIEPEQSNEQTAIVANAVKTGTTTLPQGTFADELGKYNLTTSTQKSNEGEEEKTADTENPENEEEGEEANTDETDPEEEATANEPVLSSPVKSYDAAPRILKPETTTQVKEQKPQTAQIQEVGASVRTFQQEVKTVDTAVREALKREAQVARETALREAELEENNTFDADERAQRLRAIADKLSGGVQEAITQDSGNIESVLKSSLEELRLLIKEETGVEVDLSPSARIVIDAVEAGSERVINAREELKNRSGLDLYRDTDNDGISDYDERTIYETDPEDAFTAGGALTDGERVLLGFDPRTVSSERIPVESPRVSGEIVENVFEVQTIRVALSPLEGDSVEGAPPPVKETMEFAGRSLPNSFVTLYIFSTPIVITVKADASGAWTYTLQEELPDGEHELHVATVDGSGRIIAKSPAVPFTKRAQAAEFTPLLVVSPETPTFTEFLIERFWLAGGLLALAFALIALAYLGMRPRMGGTEQAPPA